MPNHYRLFIIACTACIIAFASLALYGWIFHVESLIQLRPTYAAMQPNSSICFFLCVGALLSLDTRYVRYGRAACIAVAVIAGLTLLEYLLHIDIGIDTFFIHPYSQGSAPFIGRMGLKTTSVFLLSTIALFLCASIANPNQRTLLTVALLGCIVTALGTVTLLGYIGGLGINYSWGSFTQMSLQTSVGFTLLGICLILESWKKSRGAAMWIPIPIFLGFITIAITLSDAVRHQENIKFEALMEQEANHLSNETNLNLLHLAGAMDRMAARWNVAGGTPRTLWESDATAYIEGFRYLYAIEWLDSDLRVQWVMPAEKGRNLVGTKPNNDSARLAMINDAIRLHTPVLSHSLTLLQGGTGFLYIAPLYAHDQPNGLLVAVFRSDEFFKHILSPGDISQFFLTLREHNSLLFSNTPGDASLAGEQKHFSFNAQGIEWQVDISPTPELLATRNSLVAASILTGGTITAFLIALSLFLAMRWQSDSKSLRSFARVIEDSLNEIYVVDAETLRFLQVNRGARVNLGYSLDELLQMTPLSIKNEFTAEEYNAFLEPLRTKEKDKVVFHATHRRKDGTEYKVEVHVQLSHYRGREAYFQIVLDETERHKAEADLRESEERYDFAIKGLSVGIWDWNIITNELYWSPRLKEIVGLAETTFVPHSNSFVELLHPDDREHTLSRMVNHLKGRGTYDVEYRLRRRDGMYIWIHSKGQAQWNEQGTPQRMVGSVEDITSRKRQEEALIASEEIFRSTIEHASIGMALLDPAGRWLKVNRALSELTGYSPYELMQTDFQSITYPEDLEADLEYVRQILAGEIQTYQLQKRYFHKSGHLIWVLLSVSLVRNSDGTPRYFISQIQDITQQKEMERIKNEFISIVSHELRTPLTSIRGSLGLIAGTMSKELPEQVNKLITIAYKNCERLILLINDILDIDKIASGQMRFDLKRENLVLLVQQTVEATRAYAEKFKVTYTCEFEDSYIAVFIDAQRVIQVLANLLSNAAKFSPEGEQVIVTVSRRNGNAQVSVRDFGAGISEEFRPRIFGKFSQADSSLTRKKGGTGLGLHISKQIIEQMNGEIGFDSQSGGGTTFWIILPEVVVEQTAAPKSAKDSAAKRFQSSRRVLMCQEDETAAELVKAILKKSGLIGDIAHSVAKAKKMLAEFSYHAVIVDLLHNEDDPVKFIHELRTKPETQSLPILMMAAKTRGKGTVYGDVIGVVDWCSAPFDDKQITQAMDNAVGMSGASKPSVIYIKGSEDRSVAIASTLPPQAGFSSPALSDAKIAAEKQDVTMIVLDLSHPECDGMKLVEHLHEQDNDRIQPPLLILAAPENTKPLIARLADIMTRSRLPDTKIADTITSLIY